jgi:hypothetical protein
MGQHRIATLFGRTHVIAGSPRPDVIVGLGGNDLIEGMGGNDVPCGSRGDDLVSGATTATRSPVDPATTALYGRDDHDVVFGGGGDGQLTGGGLDLPPSRRRPRGVLAERAGHDEDDTQREDDHRDRGHHQEHAETAKDPGDLVERIVGAPDRVLAQTAVGLEDGDGRSPPAS